MTPSPAEVHLLREILEEDNSWDDKEDTIIDGWNRIVRKGKKAIWFESLFNQDISNRGADVPPPSITHPVPPPSISHTLPPALTSHPEPTSGAIDGLLVVVNDLKQALEDGLREVHDKLAAIDARVTNMEDYLHLQRAGDGSEKEEAEDVGFGSEKEEAEDVGDGNDDGTPPELQPTMEEQQPTEEGPQETEDEPQPREDELAMVLYVPPDPLQVVTYTLTDSLYVLVDELKEQMDEQDKAGESSYKRLYTRKGKGGDRKRQKKTEKQQDKVRSPVMTRRKNKEKQ